MVGMGNYLTLGLPAAVCTGLALAAQHLRERARALVLCGLTKEQGGLDSVPVRMSVAFNSVLKEECLIARKQLFSSEVFTRV